MTRIVSTLYAALLLAACSPNNKTPAAGLITNQGSFPSPSGGQILVVGTKPKSLVDYKIINSATRVEFAPENLFSDAMRWAACWESDETLWIHSSDVGLSVWQRNPNGNFNQHWVGDKTDLIPKIPIALWNFLPSSIKKQWESHRQSDSEQAQPE